jgi:two-component system cell cycle sensor histidine kinase/response regulator CckA
MDPAMYKILVVEDEGLIAHDIADRLAALGHKVIATAATAEEAIERASGADLVLMDIRLDGRADGIEAAAEIRARYHLPVIFLTAHADRSTLERAKTAAPFGYIVKPLSHNSLNTSIEMAMHKYRLERQLEEREAWMRTVLGSVADAVVVADASGRVVMLNLAAEVLTGWPHAEAQGQPVSKVVALAKENGAVAGEDPVALAMLRDAVVPLARSWRLVSRSGREMSVEGAAAPVKTNTGIIGAALSFRDVSARRWEEQQIRQSQKLEALGRLAAGVSTDYSNLLGIVRNRADQLLRHFGEYSPARKLIEEIEQAAVAADQINRRLAAFGSRQVCQPEPVSLNALLRRSTKLIESLAGTQIELSIRPDPATMRVRADTSQIEQALLGLILHACSRMALGGKLLIETRNAGAPAGSQIAAYAMLAVTYTGEEDEPERLFEPCPAGEEGMALAMVHAIVTEHGGYISAQRAGSGGCRFEILLPAETAAALPAARVFSRREAPAILLIESRDAVRAELHNFFEANGYNLLEAADTSEALAVSKMHEGSIDLLIGEAPLGAAAAELVREHSALKVLEIVDEAPRANQIRRPFTQAALLEKVEALLQDRAKLAPATA